MTQRIRGYKLTKLRAAWLYDHPLCVHCEAAGRVTAATQLDHIIALTNGGPDFDRDEGKNRQGLCNECHRKKTAEDQGFTYTPTKTIGLDGWPVGEGRSKSLQRTERRTAQSLYFQKPNQKR